MVQSAVRPGEPPSSGNVLTQRLLGLQSATHSKGLAASHHSHPVRYVPARSVGQATWWSETGVHFCGTPDRVAAPTPCSACRNSLGGLQETLWVPSRLVVGTGTLAGTPARPNRDDGF